MSLLKKPGPRPHLMVVVSNLSSKQLADLGHQIKALPTPPIVTLVKNVAILGKQNVEEAQARLDLAKAKHDLNFPASSDIIHGSNPKVARDFFMNGAFDAMISRGQNGQLSATVKNFATGIEELTRQMSVIDLSSETRISSASYRPMFAAPKPQIALQESLDHSSPTNSLYSARK